MAAGAASRPRDLAAMATAEAEALFPSSGHVRRSRRPSRRGPSAALGAAMAARLLPVLRFVVKGSLAGAAVYVAYDQGLLGSGAEGAEALKKAQAALPPAVKEWTSYMGWEVRMGGEGAQMSTADDEQQNALG